MSDLEDALYIVVGENWHNPIYPYFVSSACIGAEEAYKDLEPKQKAMVDRAVEKLRDRQEE